jgi:phosphotransacetylase
MGAPVLLGDRGVIKATAARLDLNLQGMRLIDPTRSEDAETFAVQLEQIRRTKGLSLAEAREAVRDSNTYATLMLAAGQADALVSGATVSASSALRPLFQVIPRLQHVQTASSLMILDFEEKAVGTEGVLFLADCGVIPEPTAEQLADIAVSTAMIARHLTNALPRVAMRSRGCGRPPSWRGPRRRRRRCRWKLTGKCRRTPRWTRRWPRPSVSAARSPGRPTS